MRRQRAREAELRSGTRCSAGLWLAQWLISLTSSATLIGAVQSESSLPVLLLAVPAGVSPRPSDDGRTCARRAGIDGPARDVTPVAGGSDSYFVLESPEESARAFAACVNGL